MKRRSTVVLLALVAVLALPLAACGSDGSDATATSAATAGDGPAPGEEAAGVALEEDRVVIDVRTVEEHDAGHIAGARRIGLADDDFADQIGDLDPDARYVVYCRSGNRSAQAATKMRALGLDVLDGGGMDDMEAAGWQAGE